MCCWSVAARHLPMLCLTSGGGGAVRCGAVRWCVCSIVGCACSTAADFDTNFGCYCCLKCTNNAAVAARAVKGHQIFKVTYRFMKRAPTHPAPRSHDPGRNRLLPVFLPVDGSLTREQLMNVGKYITPVIGVYWLIWYN